MSELSKIEDAASELEDQELAADAHGLYDATWSEEQWLEMLHRLVDDGLVSWKEVTTAILGELNPSQVGTSIASAQPPKFGFRPNHDSIHPGEAFLPYVLRWFYETSGRCIDCGTRLDLQADHVKGRETFPDPRDADWIDNMALRCRRHNVAKRKSHRDNAGRTLLPAQQALMWILNEIRPLTLRDFARLCRLYGMTMADIRFQESWAMAIWLEREGRYRTAKLDDLYDLIVWADGSVTQRFASAEPAPDGARILSANVSGTSSLCLVCSTDGTANTIRYYEYTLADLPFTYELGDRPPTDIAVWPMKDYNPPLAPRNLHLLAWGLRAPGQSVHLVVDGQVDPDTQSRPTNYSGRRLSRVRQTQGLDLLIE